MTDDDELPVGDNRRRAKLKNASALPAQLGMKLRTMFSDVEAQPVPDRLRDLVEALAAKEKKPE